MTWRFQDPYNQETWWMTEEKTTKIPAKTTIPLATPLANKFLFIEPMQHYLNYSSLVIHDLIARNRSSGQEIVELIGDNANPAKIKETLTSLNPIVFSGCGHGSYSAWSVECTTVFMRVGDPELALMKDRVIHLNSCLPPNSDIICNPHIKQISECVIGEKVLTHTGNFRKITHLFKRPYTGNLITIIPKKFLIPSKVTPEHPVFAVQAKICPQIKGGSPNSRHFCIPRKNKRCLKCKRKYFASYVPQWIEAKNIDNHSMIAYPVISSTENKAQIDLGLLVNNEWKIAGELLTAKYHPQLKVNRFITVNDDLMSFCGLYVAEGHVDRGTIQFSLGPTEENLALKISNYANNLFNLHATIRKANHGYTVRLFCYPLARFLSDTFETHAELKKVPNWLLTLPIKLQMTFVEGWLLGDGYTTKTGRLGNTASKVLASQIVQILLRNGIIPQIRHDKNASPKNREKLSPWGLWELYIPNKNRVGYFLKNHVLLPIKKIETTSYSGDVCNIEVEDDNSYVTPSITVHNCQTGADLGPAIMDADALAYLGSNESFWFYVGDDPNTTRAVQSPFLAEWQFDVSLMQGKTVGEARADHLAKYEEELNYWVEGDGKNHADGAELARIINMNKTISTFAGEAGTKPSPTGVGGGTMVLPPEVIVPLGTMSAVALFYWLLR